MNPWTGLVPNPILLLCAMFSRWNLVDCKKGESLLKIIIVLWTYYIHSIRKTVRSPIDDLWKVCCEYLCRVQVLEWPLLRCDLLRSEKGEQRGQKIRRAQHRVPTKSKSRSDSQSLRCTSLGSYLARTPWVTLVEILADKNTVPDSANHLQELQTQSTRVTDNLPLP